MDENKFAITLTIMIILGILTFSGIIAYSMYRVDVLRYENFQVTIKDLSDEQKCLHICGFNFPSTTYYENYKFCMEKCDRISEREQKCGVLNG